MGALRVPRFTRGVVAGQGLGGKRYTSPFVRISGTSDRAPRRTRGRRHSPIHIPSLAESEYEKQKELKEE